MCGRIVSKSFGSATPINISFSVLFTVPVPSLFIDPSAASNTSSERSSSTLSVIAKPVTSSCLTMLAPSVHKPHGDGHDKQTTSCDPRLHGPPRDVRNFTCLKMASGVPVPFSSRKHKNTSRYRKGWPYLTESEQVR